MAERAARFVEDLAELEVDPLERRLPAFPFRLGQRSEQLVPAGIEETGRVGLGAGIPVRRDGCRDVAISGVLVGVKAGGDLPTNRTEQGSGTGLAPGSESVRYRTVCGLPRPRIDA